MYDPQAVLRSPQQHNSGYRTPTIEDDNHPLNLWRSRLSLGGTDESYFVPQGQTTSEQLERLRKLDVHATNKSDHPHHESATCKDHLPWKERVKHITWAYFTICMATGGLANVLHAGVLKLSRPRHSVRRPPKLLTSL